MDIAPLKSPNELSDTSALSGLAGGANVGDPPQGPSFKDVLSNFISEVNTLQHKAGESIDNLATGKIEDLHEVMIAMSKAEVSFKFMIETRNKLLETYKEVMRMQM
ncbi:MAG TPA: flagellar hook-basal body complex protein FliE [Candidatus Brocadiia bacterium]|nr:flagellar hook-basal body complex protein FliE [Planctomycetota bacterium]MDO8092229.1 flagellar hook-basal body complex protein FliE [Candidatus Brocadiales bacterium]